MQAQTAQHTLQAKCLQHAVKKASAEELQASRRDTEISEPRFGVSCRHVQAQTAQHFLQAKCLQHAVERPSKEAGVIHKSQSLVLA